MYRAKTYDSVFDIEALDALDKTSKSARLVIHDDLNDAALQRMASSAGLAYIEVIEIDNKRELEGIATVLSSPLLTRVHTIVTKQCDWGEYHAHFAPYGWTKNALSPLLETLFKNSPVTHLVCQGDVPSYEQDEYNGTIGFVGVSEWWDKLKTLELETTELNDALIAIMMGSQMFEQLDVLRLASPMLTDDTPCMIARIDKDLPFVALEIEGYLISHEGWSTLSVSSIINENDRLKYAALARSEPMTWNQLFGNLRGLLQHQMTDPQFELVIDQLTKLLDLNAERYDAEVLPYLENIDRTRWPDTVDCTFGGYYTVHYINLVHRLLPFIEFSIITADPSWSGARWADLGEANALHKIKSIESYYHNFDDDQVVGLLESKTLTNLKSILILQDSIQEDIEGFVRLIASPQLIGLTHLEFNLDTSTSGVPIAQAILKAPCLQTLQTLKFQAGGKDTWRPLLKTLPCFVG